MKDGKILTMHRKNRENRESYEHSDCCNSSAGEEWVSSQSVIVIRGMMAHFARSADLHPSLSNCITMPERSSFNLFCCTGDVGGWDIGHSGDGVGKVVFGFEVMRLCMKSLSTMTSCTTRPSCHPHHHLH